MFQVLPPSFDNCTNPSSEPVINLPNLKTDSSILVMVPYGTFPFFMPLVRSLVLKLQLSPLSKEACNLLLPKYSIS